MDEDIKLALETHLRHLETAVTHIKACLKGHNDRNGHHVPDSVDPSMALGWASVLRREGEQLDELLKKMAKECKD